MNSNEQPSVLETERSAIETIRFNHPQVPKMTLAKQIEAGKFNTTDSMPGDRPLLSIYSVIRRYDARNSQ